MYGSGCLTSNDSLRLSNNFRRISNLTAIGDVCVTNLGHYARQFTAKDFVNERRILHKYYIIVTPPGSWVTAKRRAKGFFENQTEDDDRSIYGQSRSGQVGRFGRARRSFTYCCRRRHRRRDVIIVGRTRRERGLIWLHTRERAFQFFFYIRYFHTRIIYYNTLAPPIPREMYVPLNFCLTVFPIPSNRTVYLPLNVVCESFTGNIYGRR